MAQQFNLITWQFSADDYGTHSGNYLQKLKNLVNEYNGVLTAFNAQLVAGEDSNSIKSDIINIRDVDIVNLIGVITSLRDNTVDLRDQTIVLRDATQAIALGDINGTNPDFSSVKVAGFNVYHPGNKPSKAVVGLPSVNNTSDVNKPISIVQQNAFDAQQLQINKAILLSLGVR